MNTLLSGLVTISGAIVGFLGALYIFRKTIQHERKRELDAFYSEIDYIINCALSEKYGEAKGYLNHPELHYIFAKFWLYITPRSFRKDLYNFLKEGHKIEEKKKSGELKELYNALQETERKNK